MANPIGPMYRVAFAFGISPGTVPTTPQWTYLDRKIKSVEIVRGRNRETELVQPTRCRLKLDDPARDLEPDFAASPYSPNVVPMTPVKVECIFTTTGGVSTTYARFTGYVDDFIPLWNAQSEVVIPCTDAMAALQMVQLRNPYVAEVLKAAPDVYWRLTETSAAQLAADESGNGHPGQYQGTPTFSQTDPITDSVDGAVAFPSGSWVGGSAGPETATSISMAVWFRHAAVSVANPMYLTAWTTSAGYGQQITMGGTGGSPGQIGVFTGGGGYTTAARYDDDAWHFLVLTLDGTNGHLYIDGADVSGAFSAIGPYLSGQITVGGWPLSGDVYSFGGSVDEPTFWANRVLTATEITNMYAARTAWLGQTTDQRITSVLAVAGWGWGTVLDTGVSTLQSAGDLDGTTALDAIQQATGRGGEGGLFFIDAQGRAIFHNRHWPLTHTTVTATFGDTSGELRFTSVEPESSNSTIRNEWRGRRVGGPAQVASDATSIGRYMRRSEPQGGEINFIVQTDMEVNNRLQYYLAHYKDPLFTVRRMVMQQSDANTIVPACFGLDLESRITVNRRPHGGTLHGQDHLVQGWTENYGTETETRWKMTFQLSPADTQAYWVWGTSTWSGTTRWGP